MQLRPAPLLLLGAALGVFVPAGCCGSPSHFLRYYYLEVSEPSQERLQFFIRGCLDDQPIARFDSLTRKMEPLVPWMEEKEKKTFLALEWAFRADLEKLSKLNHPTEGLHTWQAIWGCEIMEDGSKGGIFRYGYDGKDFISFDKETLRWVAAQAQAQKVKEKWEEDPGWSKRNKAFLEETCIEWLQRYLSYRNEAPKKTEPPVGKVTHKVVSDSLEVLICQAFGFYPKEIQATWMRDREVWKNETLHRNVTPNSDGTYYVWLSIEIDPKERDRFRCHLEHEGLQEPLVLAWKEDTVTGWWIPVGIVAALISGIFCLMGRFWRRRMSPYQKAKSSLDDFPSEILSSSLNCGIDNKIQSEPMLQSEVTSEDRVSYGEWNSQRALENSGSTLRRREGKQQPLRRSKSWAGELETLDKAEATVRRELAMVAQRQTHSYPTTGPNMEAPQRRR